MKSPVPIKRRNVLTLNMTPMIDVIFLLLIFFICTASFSPLEELLPMVLSHPGSIDEVVKTTAEEEDFKFVMIHLSLHEGSIQWQLEGRLCRSLGEVETVLTQLASIKSDLPILIETDDEVAWEHFIHAYDLCRQLGLSRVQIVAE